jgi:hypothetical protein
MRSIFFWDMTPCSALSGTRRFGGTYRLHLQDRRIVQQSSEQASGTCWLAALLNYSTTLKMEAIRSSETSGTTQRTTRRHIPEEDTLQNHRCENLKSYTLIFNNLYKREGEIVPVLNRLSTTP